MIENPKISVISPSFNCAHLLRRCIDGVLAQGYKNFEHIIVDGASTDGSVEILKSYPHLRWLSEPDGGEAEALNKALKMVTGDIVNWLNVDDQYFGTDVFDVVVKGFRDAPDCDVVYGMGLAVNESTEVTWYRRPILPVTLGSLMRWTANLNLFQPAMFYTKRMMDDVGPFAENLKYAIDNDYWLRIAAKNYKYSFVERVLALATLVRTGAKSGGTYEEQHIAWQEVTAPFQQYLTHAERVFYWKDFFLFRIKPPVEYKSTLQIPDGEAELHGLCLAALELGHIPYASLALERLTASYSNTPDVYWLLAELFQKTGNGPLSSHALQCGAALLNA